jgi:hypothetical protein
VVPFADVLGAIKGLSSLLADSSAWLAPLLQEAALKQLNEFGAATLPALAKLYGRNPRVQDLVRAVHACMQGQLVEVAEDVEAAGGGGCKPSAAAAAGAAAATAEQRPPPLVVAGPVAEGTEGGKGSRRKKKSGGSSSSWQGSSSTQQHDEGHRQASAAEAEEAGAATLAGASSSSAAAAAAATAPAELCAGDEQHSAAAGRTAASPHAEEAATTAAAAGDVAAAAAAAAAVAAAMSPCSSPRSQADCDEVDASQVQMSLVAGAGHAGVPTPASPECAQHGQVRAWEAAAGALAASDAGGSGAGGVAASAATAAEPQAAAHAGEEVLAAAPAAEPLARKRTLKGLFQATFSTSQRKRDKAAAVSGAPTPPNEPAQEAPADAPAAPAAAAQGADEPGAQQDAAVEQRQEQQQPDLGPCPSLALMPGAGGMGPGLSAASLQRPPGLPWERWRSSAAGQPAAAAGDAPEQAAAALRASATDAADAANRLMAEVAAVDSPMHQGWACAGAAGLEAAAAQTQMQQPAPPQQQGSIPVSPLGRRKASMLKGFMSLLPHRAAHESGQQLPEGGLATDLVVGAAACAPGSSAHNMQQQHKQHAPLLLPGQGSAGVEEPARSPFAREAAIPAAWGPVDAEQPPQQQPAAAAARDAKGRMKGMLSMLRRGSARAASVAATAAVAKGADGGSTSPRTPEARVTAEVQLPLAALAVAAARAAERDAGASRGHAADEDARSAGSQPDASEDFDEDQPSKSRRTTGLMHRIREFMPQAGTGREPGRVGGAGAQHGAGGTRLLYHAADTPGGCGGRRGVCVRVCVCLCLCVGCDSLGTFILRRSMPVCLLRVGAAGGRHHGLKGLKFTANKLMRAMGDRRQSRAGEF